MVDFVGFSKISNEELDKLIRYYRNIQCLVYGCSMILEHLHSRGIEVQQKRVVESIVSVNPNGCHMRYSCLLGIKDMIWLYNKSNVAVHIFAIK